MLSKEYASQAEERLLTPDEVARYLGVSIDTLSVWRSTKRQEIVYIKVGRLVKYRKSDVEKWLVEHSC